MSNVEQQLAALEAKANKLKADARQKAAEIKTQTRQKTARLDQQAKKLRAKISEQKRRERTRRLIQVGAVVEAALNREFTTEQDREFLGQTLRSNSEIQQLFSIPTTSTPYDETSQSPARNQFSGQQDYFPATGEQFFA